MKPTLQKKYFQILPASETESRNTLILIIGLILLGLVNIYFAPIKLFLNDVLGVESINGCPLLTFTGVPCPFCGTGRVFDSVLGMNILGSFYYNPLGLVFYMILGLVFSLGIVLAIMKKKFVLTESGYRLWFIPVGFLVIMWILNILFGHHH
jgi:Protein of unknown function (DUF2752)